MNIALQKLHPLDDPNCWIKFPTHDAPLQPIEVASVQRDVDSIIGTTRDSRSIAVVVWNGDMRYWKQFHTDWNEVGQPIGEILKRPLVLYKSVFNERDEFIRDAFVPRWLLLTRVEREQYVPTWKRDTQAWDAARRCNIQVQPAEPPLEKYRWFQTIAEHNNLCCKLAAKNDVACWGFYAHPRSVLQNLRDIRKGMQVSNIRQSDPFASYDEVAAKVAENSTNNYEEQAMRQFRSQQERRAAEQPLTLVSPETMEQGKSLGDVRKEAQDSAKRNMDRFAQQIRKTI